MKKILLFASVLMAMTTLGSCSKNETLSVNQIPNEISFSAYTNSTTKADIVNTANFKDFVVYGYQTEANYSGASALGTPYIDALPVTREDDSKPWSHENKYYWPVDGKKMQVFALSPNDALVTNYATSETTYPTFNYTIGEVGSTQKDLVVSSLINQTKPEGSSSLVLDFKHVLSQINFSVKGEAVGLKYHVSKIELLNIKNSGKFTFNTSSKVGVWSNVEGVATYAHNLANFVVEGTTTKALSGDDRAMILMPQVNTENAKIKVTYSVTDDNGGATIFDGSKEIDLSSLAWTMNSNIRYTLTLPIGAEEITFETSVTPWGEEVNNDLPTISLDKKELYLKQNETAKLTASLSLIDDVEFKWSSDNEKVVSVDGNGNVTALAENGSANITVESFGKTASCYVFIDKVLDIPDANFKSCLINNPQINKNGDDEITLLEAFVVTELNINSKNIKSLEGIQNFIALRKLSCYKNSELSSLNLKSNTELKYLDCVETGITTIDVSENLKLETFFCSYTNLKSLELGSNDLLLSLSCHHTLLTSIDVSKNNRLNHLNFANTEISSVNLTNNYKLNNLICSNTKLSTLDISKNLSLKELECTDNPLLTSIIVWGSFNEDNYPNFNKPLNVSYIKK